MRRLVSRVRVAIGMLDARKFALKAARCPFCGPSLFVRLNAGESGVRCLRCAASAVHLALGSALRDALPNLAVCDACELSARGPLVDHLRRHARSLALSEYLDGVEPGTVRDGVRCEDMQRLSYADDCFDLVTHSEVLEHVPDDARALGELHRVLRPGGTMLFTVPLHQGERTVERARVREGRIEHLCEPIHHDDPLRATGILAFRDYGRDIRVRVREAGFTDVRLVPADTGLPWLPVREVILARKPPVAWRERA